ncbi:hypothetical protein ACFW3D_21140 [Streptomyces sp. NPDC058864]
MGRVQPCGGDHASNVWLSSWEEEVSSGAVSTPAGAGEAADSGWHMWSSARIGRTTFPLFSPPSSWRVETTGTQELLKGRTYALTFTGPRGSNGNTYDGHVYFTADDLESLDPGQVWADGRAMSRDAFRELVDDNC